MARLRTFRRSPFTLWADRVPVMNGNATIYTLWLNDGERYVRMFGGKQIGFARKFISSLRDG